MQTSPLHNRNEAVQSLAAGDAKSFSELYSNFYLQIYFFAKKFVTDPQKAEDITADVFVKLWNEAEKNKMVKNVKSFLHATTKNCCLDQLKTERIHQDKHR